MTDNDKQRLRRFIGLFKAQSPEERLATIIMLWGMLSEQTKDAVLNVLGGDEDVKQFDDNPSGEPVGH
jgi:hypothetical protein